MKRSDLQRLRAVVADPDGADAGTDAVNGSAMTWAGGVLVWDRRGPGGTMRYERNQGDWRPLTRQAVREFEREHGTCAELRRIVEREDAAVA